MHRYGGHATASFHWHWQVGVLSPWLHCAMIKLLVYVWIPFIYLNIDIIMGMLTWRSIFSWLFPPISFPCPLFTTFALMRGRWCRSFGVSPWVSLICCSCVRMVMERIGTGSWEPDIARIPLGRYILKCRNACRIFPILALKATCINKKQSLQVLYARTLSISYPCCLQVSVQSYIQPSSDAIWTSYLLYRCLLSCVVVSCRASGTGLLQEPLPVWWLSSERGWWLLQEHTASLHDQRRHSHLLE